MRRLSIAVIALVTAGTALAAGDPQRRHTAADQARARAAVLRVSDLAGWKTQRAAMPTPGTRCRSYSPNLSRLVETGAAASRQFSRGRWTTSSDVRLFATPDQAAAAWKELASGRMLSCVREAFASTPTIHVRALSNRRLPFPRLAPRSVAFRSSFRLTGFADPKPFRGTFDLIVLGRGRALAALATSADGGTFPATLERHLAALIASRLSLQ
jgi:hypothetical protein